MGRISDALKRAQRERAKRTHQEPSVATLAEETAAAVVAKIASAGSTSAAAQGPAPLPIVEPPATTNPFVVTAPPVLPDAIDPRVVALHDSTSPIAEKYRSVRTRLLTGSGGATRAFAITSSAPREGKTVTAANLAFSLAELKHLRVAMVDLDLRYGGLSRLLGVRERPGMSEVLRGEKSLADVCLPVVRGNLYLLPAGDRGSFNPSELLSGSRAGAVFKEINDRFHYSLIDTPPVSTVADIGLIAPLCHSVLIVIRMNRTPEPLLRRSVKMLQANHVPITGCILAGYSEASLYAEQDYEDTGT